MKVRLTPELSYVIGLWKTVRTKEGIGVRGSQELLDTFVKLIVDLQIIEPDKVQVKENRVYFYHTKYKRFFFKIIDNELDKFKYINDYSGNFVAGLFDASGDISSEGIVSIHGLSRKDEILLMRLGFLTARKKDSVVIMKPRLFLRFVKPYLKLKIVPDKLVDVRKRRSKSVK